MRAREHRTGEWDNEGVTMTPRKRPRREQQSGGKGAPAQDPETRKIRNSLADRMAQHAKYPVDPAGKEYHGGSVTAKTPGSRNPRK